MLDDDILIHTLESSKKTSDDIAVELESTKLYYFYIFYFNKLFNNNRILEG